MLYFEDVDEGDEAPVRSWLLTRTDLVMYAGASGDDNPMHHDEVLAQQAGQPSVFGHGMFSMGFLGTAITDYVGMANIRRYRARFVRQTASSQAQRWASIAELKAMARKPRGTIALRTGTTIALAESPDAEIRWK